MARGLNTVMLAGTIVQDPELRYTQNGLAILEPNLAGNDHVIGEDGESRHLAWYHRATLFGAYAEIMVNQVAAGVPVLVEGASTTPVGRAPRASAAAASTSTLTASRCSASARAAARLRSSTPRGS